MTKEITQQEQHKKTGEQENLSKRKFETNEIFVGNKPFMKYVIATIMQLQNNGNNSAVVKARGKFISKAVDIAEVVKKRMKENDMIELKTSVGIGTDGFKNQEGKNINISTIDVELSK